MAGQITVEKRDHIAVLTLVNPTRRNALDPAMLTALVEALAALPGEGVRAAVLTGDGELFSSGYDIRALPAGAPPTANPLGPALAAIADGKLPVIAALNGTAIGGGCELAATCDLRVAHAGVSLTMPPARLGLVYSPFGLRRFVSLIGLSRTRELFLTAAPVAAERALAWGLVDRVVPAAEVLPTALALATEIAGNAPLAVAGMRRALELIAPPIAPGGLAEMAALHAGAWAGADAAEARAAFMEKRKPVFRGE
jgi:enoyl-CoA hydratase/carnithine racemase